MGFEMKSLLFVLAIVAAANACSNASAAAKACGVNVLLKVAKCRKALSDGAPATLMVCLGSDHLNGSDLSSCFNEAKKCITGGRRRLRFVAGRRGLRRVVAGRRGLENKRKLFCSNASTAARVCGVNVLLKAAKCRKALSDGAPATLAVCLGADHLTGSDLSSCFNEAKKCITGRRI